MSSFLPLSTEVYATNTGESYILLISSYIILTGCLLSTIETRGKPRERTAEFVRVATTYATRRRHPFLGHKMESLQSRWSGFDFYRYTPGEPMHGELLSILFFCNTPTSRTFVTCRYCAYNENDNGLSRWQVRDQVTLLMLSGIRTQSTVNKPNLRAYSKRYDLRMVVPSRGV